MVLLRMVKTVAGWRHVQLYLVVLLCIAGLIGLKFTWVAFPRERTLTHGLHITPGSCQPLSSSVTSGK